MVIRVSVFLIDNLPAHCKSVNTCFTFADTFCIFLTWQKDERIAVRLDTKTKAALTSAAEEDKRSLSSMVEKIVTDWLRHQASEAKGR